MTHYRWLVMADPVHGILKFDRTNSVHRLLLKVINSYAFQRLRRVKQMGLAEFVFPGATHSRFSHSLGAAHLMGRCTATFREHEANKRVLDSTYGDSGISLECLLTMGILLHDLGHPPLSHTLEDALDLDKKGLGHDHYWLFRILAEDDELQAIWEEFDVPNLPKALQEFMGEAQNSQGIQKKHYLASLVSGQLDMDRLDYLIRDSHFLGVKYGQVEIDRLIDCLDIHNKHANGEAVVTVLEDALPALEHYLFARHQAYKMALHSLDKASEALMQLTLLRYGWAKDNKQATGCQSAELYHMMRNGHALNVADYLRMDDAYLWEAIHQWSLEAEDPQLKALAMRLMRHDLPKFVDIQRAKPDITDTQRDDLLDQMKQHYSERQLNFEYGFTRSIVKPKALYSLSKAPIWIATQHRGVVELPDASSLPLTQLSGQGNKELWFVWDKTAQRKLYKSIEAL